MNCFVLSSSLTDSFFLIFLLFFFLFISHFLFFPHFLVLCPFLCVLSHLCFSSYAPSFSLLLFEKSFLIHFIFFNPNCFASFFYLDFGYLISSDGFGGWVWEEGGGGFLGRRSTLQTHRALFPCFTTALSAGPASHCWL